MESSCVTLSFPSIVTTRHVVPNCFPLVDPTEGKELDEVQFFDKEFYLPDEVPTRKYVTHHSYRKVPYRIAIVGEAPGETEENHLAPFVGPSGNLLNSVLSDAGIDRHRVFLGNICQVRPPANNISAFDWNSHEIQSGLAQLTSDLNDFNPHLCVLLGGTPLRAARGDPKAKITDWRGSLFIGSRQDSSTNAGVAQQNSPFAGRKCLAAYHPAYVLREWSEYPLLKLDIQRARDEGESPTLILPQRELITGLSGSELSYILDTWPASQRCSLDIEGGLGGWPCVSICARPTKSITIAWGKLSEQEHAMVLRSFSRLMARTDVPKVLQNSLYDNFVLSYGFGIPLRNVVEDTMLKGWECYCELPKGLGTQASIWTREPFYKAERKSDNAETFFQYCAKDSAVTLEICNAQDNVLSGDSLKHYRFNMEMLNPLLYMELRGIRYDKESAATQFKQNQDEIRNLGETLSSIAGHDLRGEKGSLSSDKLKYCLYQQDPGFTPKGRRKTLVEWKNPAYPPQYKKEAGRKTEKLTTDVEALLALARHRPSDTFLSSVLRHRHLEGLIETLSVRADSDGRVRCGYNVVGTETGRLTCYTSPTGSGANLTTITKSLRKNYIADPNCDFFQCDLEGADGWTVATHCARLGDSTMLDDYRAGLKPAKILGLLYWFGPVINELSRSDLKFLHDNAFPLVAKLAGPWLYMGCKRIFHGDNYDMRIPTMVKQVLLDSYKYAGTPVYLEHADARILQNAKASRYPGVRSWHQWSEAKLVADGKLTSCSGQTRLFFGRRLGKDIHNTVKEFLAHEPQATTTYVTNRAMLNLWNDPNNRKPSGGLIIEPLHQVHDALCGQWPQLQRDWAKQRVREYFNIEIEVAGTKLTIPFEGKYGRSWGELTETI